MTKHPSVARTGTGTRVVSAVAIPFRSRLARCFGALESTDPRRNKKFGVALGWDSLLTRIDRKRSERPAMNDGLNSISRVAAATGTKAIR